jgi:hypothetical protein
MGGIHQVLEAVGWSKGEGVIDALGEDGGSTVVLEERNSLWLQ